MLSFLLDRLAVLGKLRTGMKKLKRGRPTVPDQHKVGISISMQVLLDAKAAAIKSRRTLSGFFEIAARKEIERVNSLTEAQL